MHKQKKRKLNVFFIFGFCILLRVLSRLLEVPSLATSFQIVYFCCYMFRPLLAILKWNTQLFLEVIHLQQINCFVIRF
jgi:hypothetical protein